MLAGALQLGSEAFVAICRKEGLDPEKLVLHSDNAGPMKGASMVATLAKLGVTQSLSRPSVSNDNPFSEAIFRTAKYRPSFANEPLESLEAARSWVAGFVPWYNEEHQHGAISFLTPQQRHAGHQEEILFH